MRFYTEKNKEDKRIKVEIEEHLGDGVNVYFICGDKKILIGTFKARGLTMETLGASEIKILKEYDIEIDDNEVKVG